MAIPKSSSRTIDKDAAYGFRFGAWLVPFGPVGAAIATFGDHTFQPMVFAATAGLAGLIGSGMVYVALCTLIYRMLKAGDKQAAP